jgi:thermitase
VDTIPQIEVVTVETHRPLVFRAQASQDDDVEYVERDSEDAVEVAFTPDDPRFDDQWGFEPHPGIATEDAWNTTLGSTNVTVAVIDTGLEKSHEDLGNYLQGKDLVDDDSEPEDGNGHGTHVAGTVGALTDNGVGVAGTAQATILPVRVLGDDGSGSLGDAADGLTWTVDNGADVASMSLGCAISLSCEFSQPMEEALNYAVENGGAQRVRGRQPGPGARLGELSSHRRGLCGRVERERERQPRVLVKLRARGRAGCSR